MQQGGSSYVQAEALGITTSPQPCTNFTLGTLAFDAVGYGSTVLDLNEALNIFPNNPALTIDGFNNGQINVVPIPGALWLFGSGLFGLIGLKRKLKR